MDLDRLKEFMIIAEEKSFKKAASRLDISPNVLSTRMRRFEASMNRQLIRRIKDGIALTESGEALLPNIDAFLKSYFYATDSLQELKNHTIQRLYLQFYSNRMPAELGPYLDIFCRRHSQLILDIYDENACQARSGLKSGKIDVSFVICREHDFEDIPGRVPLAYFPIMYVHLPTDHALANEKKIDRKSVV